MAVVKDVALLSEVEQLVLLAVLKIKDDAYAVPIRSLVREETAIDLPRGSVYVTLERLEEKGLIASWASGPQAVPGGKSRRLFRILPAGMAALRASTRAMQQMIAGTSLARS
jgi:PadR family transcriptional regulator